MNSKKALNFISIFLICALIFAFTSCKTDSQENKVTDTNDNISNNSDDTVEEPTESTEFKPLEGADYEKYKFRIYGPGPNPIIWEESAILAAIDEVFSEKENGEYINDAVYKRNRAVEALYNIEIVPVYPGGDRTNLERTAMNLFNAGEDAYDMSLMISYHMRNFLNRKDFSYDLLQIPNLDLSNSWWSQKQISELSVANHLHMITGDISIFSTFSMNVMFQNKELASLYSLENAYDLVRQGKWTWDKLIEMCRTVAKDLDGDGVMTREDQFGICTDHSAVRFSFQAAGERITKKDADDIPSLAINKENATKIIDFMLDSFMNKDIGIYVNHQFDKYNWTNVYSDYVFPKFRSAQLLFFGYPLAGALDFRNMEWDFAILPFPKLSDKQSEYYTSTGLWYETNVYIPTTCYDIERTGAVLEALGYYSQKYIRPAVIDVTITNKLIRDDDSAEMINLLLDTRTYDLGVMFNWGNIDGDLFIVNLDRKTNIFISQYEKLEAKIITAMEKTIDEMLK